MASGKIRILFLGHMGSSHAQSWMGLLDQVSEKFETVGFSVPGSPYPKDSGKTRMFGACWGRILNSEKMPARIRKFMLWGLIFTFRPHVIHSFAAFPTGELYEDVIKSFQPKIKWVLQVRGGPDVAVNRNDPVKAAVLRRLFAHCDVLIADNVQNYEFACEMGLAPEKKWGGGIAPGTGGVDLTQFDDAPMPSASERQVIWTKAYEGFESKGLPVLAGILLAWPRIRGTTFNFMAVNEPVAAQIRKLPQDLQDHIKIQSRIPRSEILALMKKSRVVMAPSLLEGVPNSLYEAMAARCVPIFSRLDTYKDMFEDRENILYADNLDPQKIADVLVEAMTDDALADRIAQANLTKVAAVANRTQIAEKVITLYMNLSA